jgi:hypothetical protein
MSVIYGPNIVTTGLGFLIDFANPNSIDRSTYALKDLSPNKIPITLNFPEQNTLSIINTGTTGYYYAQFTPTGETNDSTYYTISDPYFNTIKDNSTLETCVYTDFFYGSPPQYHNRPVSPRTYEYAQPYTIAYGNGVILEEVCTNESGWLTTGYGGLSQVGLNKWVYITLTTTANDSYKTYVNGEYIASIDLTSKTILAFTGLLLGRGFYGGTENSAGRISFVRVYNRALTQPEITQNFNAVKGRFGF